MTFASSLYLLVTFSLFIICYGLEEHTGKLLFHSADNDPKDNRMTLIEVQRFFLLFDLNGDGTIDADEFVLAWKQHFGLTEEQANGMLKLVDQFSPKNEITEIEITSLYNLMDENGDGGVTEMEFLYFWKNIDNALKQNDRSRLMHFLNAIDTTYKRHLDAVKAPYKRHQYAVKTPLKRHFDAIKTPLKRHLVDVQTPSKRSILPRRKLYRRVNN